MVRVPPWMDCVVSQYAVRVRNDSLDRRGRPDEGDSGARGPRACRQYQRAAILGWRKASERNGTGHISARRDLVEACVLDESRTAPCRLSYLDDSGRWVRSKGALVTTVVTLASSLSSSALTVITPCRTWGLLGMSVT